MTVIDELYNWTYWVLFGGLLLLRVWAVIDCATRKAAAFPAVDKLTKSTWLLITFVGALLAAIPGVFSAPLGPISLISTIAAAVYLADVRPAVREVSGGRGRGR